MLVGSLSKQGQGIFLNLGSYGAQTKIVKPEIISLTKKGYKRVLLDDNIILCFNRVLLRSRFALNTMLSDQFLTY